VTAVADPSTPWLSDLKEGTSHERAPPGLGKKKTAEYEAIMKEPGRIEK